MLDWLADKHGHEPAAQAAARIERGGRCALSPTGIRPFEFGGRDGTATVAGAVIKAL